MYNVSEEYIAAMHGSVNRAYITFTIDGNEYTEDNILQGSFSISNQCTDTKTITLGGVYVGVLNATLRNVSILRQEWRGKQIIPTFHFLVDDENDEWETMPLGVYTISQAEWKKTGIAVRAYDNMSLLDGNVFISESEGDLYDYLTEMATACGITLAQTQQEFEALPNGDLHVAYYSDAGVETWRDLVSCIAQIIGGFATINRDGELLFVSYGNTAVDTIDTTERHTGGSFSDYATKYTGFSVTFVETKETRSYFAQINDGLTLALGDNPFLQEEDVVQDISATLLTAIAHIQYVPFNVNMAANPVYDLGDVISFVDGLAGTASAGCVQKWEFKLHKSLRLAGFGSDPSAADAKSQTQKQLVSLQNGLSQTAEQTLDYILPTTLSQSDILDGSSNTSASFDFNVSIEDAKIGFHMCLQFLAETTVSANAYSDLTVTATLTLDGTTQATIVHTYRDGDEMLNIDHLIESITNGNHTLVLTLAASGGDMSSLQFVSAYLLAAKSIGSGSVATKDLFANGDFANNVLANGFDKNLITKTAFLNGTIYNIVKYAKSEHVNDPMPVISATLSQWYLTKYALCAMMYYGSFLFTDNGIITRNSGQVPADTEFYIPLKRQTGFNKLIYEARNEYSGQYNWFALTANAVIDGVMTTATYTLNQNITTWTTFEVDISALPYVDYLHFYIGQGMAQFKNIRLVKSN